MKTALKAYQKHGIQGSPEKDVVDALDFTVAGAHVDSSRRNLRNGMITVGVHSQKRCALMTVFLAAARLPMTTRDLLEKIVGGWSRCTMYRRPTACCLSKVYRLIHDPHTQSGHGDRPHHLPRAVAEELVLRSLLARLMATNLRAEIERKLFASDASLAKGALVSTEVTAEEASLLWRTADHKGGYSKLDPPTVAILKWLGDESAP